MSRVLTLWRFDPEKAKCLEVGTSELEKMKLFTKIRGIKKPKKKILTISNKRKPL